MVAVPQILWKTENTSPPGYMAAVNVCRATIYGGVPHPHHCNPFKMTAIIQKSPFICCREPVTAPVRLKQETQKAGSISRRFKSR